MYMYQQRQRWLYVYLNAINISCLTNARGITSKDRGCAVSNWVLLTHHQPRGGKLRRSKGRGGGGDEAVGWGADEDVSNAALSWATSAAPATAGTRLAAPAEQQRPGLWGGGRMRGGDSCRDEVD